MGKKKAQYPVRFFKGTAQQYNATTPNDFCFYFITDQDKIYLGDVQLSNVEVYSRINQINNLLEDMAKISIKTTDEWRSSPQVSEKGEIYIFSDRDSKIVDDEVINIPGIKVGDGNAYIMDLPFIDDIFQEHIRNNDIHVTLAQKQFWNNKVRTEDSEIDQENLIFTIY